MLNYAEDVDLVPHEGKILIKLTQYTPGYPGTNATIPCEGALGRLSSELLIPFNLGLEMEGIEHRAWEMGLWPDPDDRFDGFMEEVKRATEKALEKVDLTKEAYLTLKIRWDKEMRGDGHWKRKLERVQIVTRLRKDE